MTARVAGLKASMMLCGSIPKPFAADPATRTGVAPANRTCSGNVTQQGDGRMTSSPA